jgi:hypothetical protein
MWHSKVWRTGTASGEPDGEATREARRSESRDRIPAIVGGEIGVVKRGDADDETLATLRLDPARRLFRDSSPYAGNGVDGTIVTDVMRVPVVEESAGDMVDEMEAATVDERDVSEGEAGILAARETLRDDDIRLRGELREEGAIGAADAKPPRASKP